MLNNLAQIVEYMGLLRNGKLFEFTVCLNYVMGCYMDV